MILPAATNRILRCALETVNLDGNNKELPVVRVYNY